MKKIFTILAVSSLLFAACSSESVLDAKKDVVLTDTTGMYKSNASTDVSTPVATEEEVAPTKIIRETRIVYVDRTPKARRQTVRQASPVYNEPVANVPETKSSETASTQGQGQTQSGQSTGTETSTGTVEEKEEKKGWSNAAKGAVIGGVGGAVTGAILSKNKVKGAIIGGVLGAGGGYVLGRKKDKNDN